MSDYRLLRQANQADGNASSVIEALQARASQDQRTLSFEFFPPKDDESAAALWKHYETLIDAQPDFVSVTYGAGGSSRETSLAVVDRMAKDVLTVGHLTCVGATARSSRETIKHFEQAGVSSILALRGDPPLNDPQALLVGEMKTALDLVRLAREVSSLEIGVAAFPEVHPESPSMQHDAHVLRIKQDAGASFAMTQLFFSVEAYLRLVSAAKDAGSVMPIVPGLMPISNAAKVLRMAQMSGADVPRDLLEKLENASESEARVIGMDYSVQLANDLLKAGAPGLHIFTLNYSKAALEVARGCGLA